LTGQQRFHAFQPGILATEDGTRTLVTFASSQICMSTRGDESARKAQALAAYRESFKNFSEKARFIQDMTATRNLDRSLVDAAMLELEKAHSVYVERRNTLAYFLLPSTARDRVGAPDSKFYKSQVRRVAELLWEVSGRPPGTANDDWYRAEEIVRSVAAA
jgi:hypothetical protein